MTHTEVPTHSNAPGDGFESAHQLDCVIIGAGAAGLAAARDLRRAGRTFVVIEARSRVGGRVFTYRDPAVPVPMELGAEFLHGSTPETSAILHEAGLTGVEVVGEHWQAQDGEFSRANDFWKRVDRVLGKLDEQQTPDRSFADFLAEQAHRGKSKPKHQRARRMALEFVQGFHAADPERVSERWLAMEMEPSDSPEESRMARVVDGYDRVTAYLAREVFDAVLLNTAAECIEWTEHDVTVSVRAGANAGSCDPAATGPIRARSMIITVPVGVLRAEPDEPGAIRFQPEVPGLADALSHLAMGTVQRTVMAFRERFWERLPCGAAEDGADGAGPTLADLSFLHTPGSTVPVWWTLFPLLTPVMVGWVGGPAAAALSALPESEIAHRAIRDLSRCTGIAEERLSGLVAGHWTHNWERDPYSRGAYSYATVGGSGAARRLSRPVQQTIFFAGEATDTDGRTGTVEGALATGRRAARGVLQALG